MKLKQSSEKSAFKFQEKIKLLKITNFTIFNAYLTKELAFYF